MDKVRARSKATTFSRNIAEGALVRYFLIWKLTLLVVACASPGPGYDTSTEVLFDQSKQPTASWFGHVIEPIVLRLTRWDGIYFASNSARGHTNEQNWAFSWALARITSFISRVLFSSLSLSPIVKDALTGILISNVSHLVAVITLYQLTLNIIPSSDLTKRRVAFTASCLHIVSPAGLFLSAPFGESAFAMLNFLGMLSYVFATTTRHKTVPDMDAAVKWSLATGLFFGLATMVRSNGILSGVVLAWDAVEMVLRPTQIFHDSKTLIMFGTTICAGNLIIIGFATPQIVAYMEYCTNGNSRPWCSRLVPSIYSWVQDHYWEVGFLRYWTINNLPLFLLAGPMLVIMLYTGYIGLLRSRLAASACSRSQNAKDAQLEEKVFNHVIPRLALPQLILATTAATSFHVQIINRISSGYPVWYILLAIAICTSSTDLDTSRGQKQGATNAKSANILPQKHLGYIVRGMAIYAIVQGGLYASFLPPA